MSLTNFFNHTASCQAPTFDTDASAGVRRWGNPTDVLTDEPVRVEDASTKEINDYGMRNIQITHRIFSTSTVPQSSYRWIFDSRYFIVRDILRRRAIGNIPDFYIYMSQEVAPNG